MADLDQCWKRIRSLEHGTGCSSRTGDSCRRSFRPWLRPSFKVDWNSHCAASDLKPRRGHLAIHLLPAARTRRLMCRDCLGGESFCLGCPAEQRSDKRSMMSLNIPGKFLPVSHAECIRLFFICKPQCSIALVNYLHMLKWRSTHPPTSYSHVKRKRARGRLRLAWKGDIPRIG